MSHLFAIVSGAKPVFIRISDKEFSCCPSARWNNMVPTCGIYAFPIEASKISNRGVLESTSSASAEMCQALFEEICSQLVAPIREQIQAV
jgi:creatinine amidohydrolase/Fe(II)-dependent formamide hydrolase-like protein